MTPPLIVHLLYRYALGGMEVQLTERLNRMPLPRYRHALVTLAGIDMEFARRLQRHDVPVYDLQKAPGLALATHVRLWRLLRALQPAVLHSYNLAAMEYGLAALVAGVPVRINGAHGRDAVDPRGERLRHRLLRRCVAPFYDSCYANSRAMAAWNRACIGCADYLPNGVDTERFTPAPRAPAEEVVIGTVGRLDKVKDQATLIDAFALLQGPGARLRLLIAGEGPCRAALAARAAVRGVADLCEIAPCADALQALRRIDIFVLPSMAEGMPGALLEAMSCGLPVVASRVGGVPELVSDGLHGTLVPAGDAAALAEAVGAYLDDPSLARAHGEAARRRVLRDYSMQASVEAYLSMYDRLCARKLRTERKVQQCAES